MPTFIVSSLERYDPRWTVAHRNAATHEHAAAVRVAQERAREYGRVYYVHRYAEPRWGSPHGLWEKVFTAAPSEGTD